jgi:putative transposase
MARKLRVEYEGAIYHVVSRGDRRQEIFLDDDDRERFLGTLGEVCERTGWLLHAYVLMGNHYHWLLETPKANLVAGMQWFQTTYTIRFNRRHRLDGHLFQGRYKAVLVEADSAEHFVALSDY